MKRFKHAAWQTKPLTEDELRKLEPGDVLEIGRQRYIYLPSDPPDANSVFNMSDGAWWWDVSVRKQTTGKRWRVIGHVNPTRKRKQPAPIVQPAMADRLRAGVAADPPTSPAADMWAEVEAWLAAKNRLCTHDEYTLAAMLRAALAAHDPQAALAAAYAAMKGAQ